MYMIEDGINTNYISCLLLSLFIDKNIIYNNLLNNNDVPIEYHYIQEIIKYIIYSIKNYKIINSDILNYLRNILYLKKFKCPDTILLNNNILELFEFLLKILSFQNIEFIYNNQIISMSYIKLNIDSSTNIKTLLYKEFNDKKLNNIPYMISIYLNKDNEHLIDIQKKITFNSIYNKSIWSIYSIICFDQYYFSFININNNWIYINDKLIPCIQIIKLKDYENIIKKYSKLLIYNIYS